MRLVYFCRLLYNMRRTTAIGSSFITTLYAANVVSCFAILMYTTSIIILVRLITTARTEVPPNTQSSTLLSSRLFYLPTRSSCLYRKQTCVLHKFSSIHLVYKRTASHCTLLDDRQIQSNKTNGIYIF